MKDIIEEVWPNILTNISKSVTLISFIKWGGACER